MPRDVLFDLAVRRAKAKAKPYRLSDGDGLTLFVARSGVKSWQFRYELAGKRRPPRSASITTPHSLNA